MTDITTLTDTTTRIHETVPPDEDEQPDTPGDPPRRHGQPWNEDDFAGIVRAARDGCNLEHIARRIGRSENSLRPQLRRILPVEERHLPPDLVPARLRQLDQDGNYDWLTALSQKPRSPWEIRREVEEAADARGLGALTDHDLVDLAVACALSQAPLSWELRDRLARHLLERDVSKSFFDHIATRAERAAEDFLRGGWPSGYSTYWPGQDSWSGQEHWTGQEHWSGEIVYDDRRDGGGRYPEDWYTGEFRDPS
ncbi:hypothetical protein [Citricoccus sp. GCM10030269]|uniref:hypothetical protein n=1 Tax=Citricoccus sp. GCM10030269 TaxID=3273388 RepID=UPI00360C6C4B